MAIQNSYTVNGALKKEINAGFADIEMSSEDGVKAGCKDYPIPLLNKITVESREGVMFKSQTIYAGYKIVQQMLGTLTPANNYNPSRPYLNTIIRSGRFGIFEPAHYDIATGTWVNYNLSNKKIQSLINLGTGIKICVKIEYTLHSSGALVPVYVDIPGVSTKFDEIKNTEVPLYGTIGRPKLSGPECVNSSYVVNAHRRSWFESIITAEALNINLETFITDPKTTDNITVTLMAYIGDLPTANNTFPILPMRPGSPTSVEVPFETYEPIIAIYNADQVNNADYYEDGYGSVAEYNSDADIDTTISISITAPD